MGKSQNRLLSFVKMANFYLVGFKFAFLRKNKYNFNRPF
ncbi:hypothetical protein HCMG_01311 [Helicobacter canadensis MIT 98-5491]|nr:hypothetical protein HCMG_01311 [Helicobacter canadensis MIT 98-5491]